MFTAFIQLLTKSPGQPSGSLLDDDQTQIWIIGTREQVIHTMNEFCAKRIVLDRARFSPIVPAFFFPGKVMTILKR